MELRKTPEEDKVGYWYSTGAYQAEYDELTAKLVGASGSGKTVHAELIRGIGRLFHDYCNNGNCNVAQVDEESCDECWGDGYETAVCTDCDGTGEIELDEGDESCYDCVGTGEIEETCCFCSGDGTQEGEVEIGEFYMKFIELIRNEVGNAAIAPVVEVIKTIEYGEHKFEGVEMTAYNNMCDLVIHHVLNSEDKDLPDSYEGD